MARLRKSISSRLPGYLIGVGHHLSSYLSSLALAKPLPLSRMNCCAQVEAVVVGFDRHINYHKIQYATLCISENPGCKFIATNCDAKTHLTDAQEWAGNGSMVGAIKGESTEAHPGMDQHQT